MTGTPSHDDPRPQGDGAEATGAGLETLDALEVLAERLLAADGPEAVFGAPALGEAPDRSAVDRTWRRLSRRCHPDRFRHDPDREELAERAWARLQALHDDAKVRIDAGTYGSERTTRAIAAGSQVPANVQVQTSLRTYNVDRVVAKGDLCTVLGAHFVDAHGQRHEVAMKVADEPRNNDLVTAEARVLRRLAIGAGNHGKHLPVVLDELRTTQGQQGTVFAWIRGLDGPTLTQRFPTGLPQRHALWIMRRALSALGYAHSRGVLHGNLEPAHLIVEPQAHNVHVVDWCWSVVEPARTGQSFRVDNPRFSPPEVAAGLPPLPSSDLFSLARCVIALLGGDPVSHAIPDRVHPRFAKMLRFFLKDSARQRPQDAWEMYWQLDGLREEIWGAHRFVPFEIPNDAAAAGPGGA